MLSVSQTPHLEHFPRKQLLPRWPSEEKRWSACSGFSLTCLVAGPGASARCKWSSCFEGPSVRPLVPLLWDTNPRSPTWLSEASPSLRHPWLHGSGVPGPWRRPPPLRWGSAPAQPRLPLALQPLGPQGAGFSLDVHQERFLRPISLRISSRPSTQQVCMQGLRWSSLALAGDADEQTKPPPLWELHDVLSVRKR